MQFLVRRSRAKVLSMRIQKLNHSTYQHQYHIVWGTKYRMKFLKEYVKPELEKSFYKVVSMHPEIYIEAMNVDDDHVHLQIEIAPSVSVAAVVQKLKQQSSKDLKQQFKFIRERYLNGKIWSVGYFSSTIGVNEELIRKYIEDQGKNDYPSQHSFGFS